MSRFLQTLILLILVAMFAAACASGNHSNNDHSHDEDDHDPNHGRVPNNGAVIRLISPTDGATFARNEEIVVQVEVENFTLGEDGKHWHIFVGDREYAMVMGANPSDVIRGLEPGEYLISVYLSDADHNDLEDGDSATITVTP
ncbi:MAG: hypothetical protein KJ063_21200 [Anaerolineae bacterium]|nr:hypothetical protein [Anaerolineae bacterium]